MSASRDEKTGKWTAQCYYENWKGEKKHKKKRGFTTKKEALEWEREFLKSTSANMDMMLGAFVDVYFRDKAGGLKERTIKNKRYMIEAHVLPYFENKQMNEISPSDIIQWQNAIRAKGYSQTYLRMVQNQITALFTHARNSFIQMSKLPNLKGRISYISSKARQENLYAVYETTDRKFWRELGKCNQEEFRESGTKGTCIEARELIIALPESFVDYEPDKLLKLFTEHFKQNYGVECISALHHNKRKTNYHIHLIFSERKLLEEPVEKIATRNMFYDENGKHVRTKKEILGEVRQLRKGCKIIPKGVVYEPL